MLVEVEMSSDSLEITDPFNLFCEGELWRIKFINYSNIQGQRTWQLFFTDRVHVRRDEIRSFFHSNPLLWYDTGFFFPSDIAWYCSITYSFNTNVPEINTRVFIMQPQEVMNVYTVNVLSGTTQRFGWKDSYMWYWFHNSLLTFSVCFSNFPLTWFISFVRTFPRSYSDSDLLCAPESTSRIWPIVSSTVWTPDAMSVWSFV